MVAFDGRTRSIRRRGVPGEFELGLGLDDIGLRLCGARFREACLDVAPLLRGEVAADQQRCRKILGGAAGIVQLAPQEAALGAQLGACIHLPDETIGLGKGLGLSAGTGQSVDQVPCCPVGGLISRGSFEHRFTVRPG
jgi:hypothetical protein